jgi:hypothetical protein
MVTRLRNPFVTAVSNRITLELLIGVKQEFYIRTPSPWEGEGRDGGSLFIWSACLITVVTPSRLFQISLFQNLTTRNPLFLNHCDRMVSSTCRSLCWPPSNAGLRPLQQLAAFPDKRNQRCNGLKDIAVETCARRFAVHAATATDAAPRLSWLKAGGEPSA